MINTHRNARHPFEVLVVGFCVFSGGAQVISREAPTAVATAVGATWQSTWSWMMLIAGLVTFIGIYIKDAESGLKTELGGLLGMGSGNLVYCIAVLTASNVPASSYAGPITFGIAFACFWRAGIIGLKLWENRSDPEKAKLLDEVKNQLRGAAEEEARRIIDSRDKKEGEGG